MIRYALNSLLDRKKLGKNLPCAIAFNVQKPFYIVKSNLTVYTMEWSKKQVYQLVGITNNKYYGTKLSRPSKISLKKMMHGSKFQTKCLLIKKKYKKIKN